MVLKFVLENFKNLKLNELIYSLLMKNDGEIILGESLYIYIYIKYIDGDVY